MKLSEQEINNILASKDLTCSNVNEYKNMDTLLHLTCKNGHALEASIHSIRNAHFKCPYCEGAKSTSDSMNNIEPPTKKGKRIIAIDNATENVGLSVYDNGQLVFYHLFHFDGDTISRLLKNRTFIEETVIDK
jgi:hypothetical protein